MRFAGSVVLGSLVLLAALSVAPEVARAQLSASLPDVLTVELEEPDLRGAHAMRQTGTGMTIGGLLTVGAGVGILFGSSGFENWSGFIVGGLAQAMGGLSALIGIPLWIVGAVREGVLSRPYDERAAAADDFELAGMVTTLTGLALMALGGALIGGSLAIRDDRGREVTMQAGGVLMPIGFVLATFIGPPIWGEGARF